MTYDDDVPDRVGRAVRELDKLCWTLVSDQKRPALVPEIGEVGCAEGPARCLKRTSSVETLVTDAGG